MSKEQLAQERFERDRNELLATAYDRNGETELVTLELSAATWNTAPSELRQHYMEAASREV